MTTMTKADSQLRDALQGMAILVLEAATSAEAGDYETLTETMRGLQNATGVVCGRVEQLRQMAHLHDAGTDRLMADIASAKAYDSAYRSVREGGVGASASRISVASADGYRAGHVDALGENMLRQPAPVVKGGQGRGDVLPSDLGVTLDGEPIREDGMTDAEYRAELDRISPADTFWFWVKNATGLRGGR